VEFPSGLQPRRQSFRGSQGESISEDPETDERASLVDGVAYLSLCASGTTDTTHEPYYVGSSSGATIARGIQSLIYRGPNSRKTNCPVVGQKSPVPESSLPRVPLLATGADDPISKFPDKRQAHMLFDTFFERIHPRWPLLDRVVYENLFEKQYVRGCMTTTERSIFHLIYAITARFLSLTKNSCGVDDEVSTEYIYCVPMCLHIAGSAYCCDGTDGPHLRATQPRNCSVSHLTRSSRSKVSLWCRGLVSNSICYLSLH
jgi:hypothetical protein